MWGRMPSLAPPDDPPDLPPLLVEEDDESVQEWRVARFEELGYTYPLALELSRSVDWHAAKKLCSLMGRAGYDEPTAREMTAEILR